MKKFLKYLFIITAIAVMTVGMADAKKKSGEPGSQKYKIEAPANVEAGVDFMTTAQHFTVDNLITLAFGIGQGFTYCFDTAEGPKKEVEITCDLPLFDPVLGRALAGGAEGIVYERVEKQFASDHPLAGTSYWINEERGTVLIFVH